MKIVTAFDLGVAAAQAEAIKIAAPLTYSDISSHGQLRSNLRQDWQSPEGPRQVAMQRPTNEGSYQKIDFTKGKNPALKPGTAEHRLINENAGQPFPVYRNPPAAPVR